VVIFCNSYLFILKLFFDFLVFSHFLKIFAKLTLSRAGWRFFRAIRTVLAEPRFGGKILPDLDNGMKSIMEYGF